MELFRKLPDNLTIWLSEVGPDKGLFISGPEGEAISINEIQIINHLSIPDYTIDGYLDLSDLDFKRTVRIKFPDGYVYVGIHHINLNATLAHKQGD
jgi:hypothetical protein